MGRGTYGTYVDDWYRVIEMPPASVAVAHT